MVDPIRNIRKLTAFLVVSGTLNIVLVFSIFYLMVRERPPTPYFELKPANQQEQQVPLAIDRSDSEVIRYFRRMPLEWLVSRLTNTQLVENGYTQRDLALASLVAFHYFDLDRAFSVLSKPEQKRLIVYGKFSDGRSAELVVYPGLSEKHFDAVRTFASTERWPLTNRGLFLALQKEDREEYDQDLLDAFFMTSHFATVEMLFSRSEQPVGREELLKVLLEGNWVQLTDFVEQQKKAQDLSQTRRQNFLLDYVKNKSKAAAQMLLKTDGIFVARKLDDKQVVMLLQLLEEKSQQAKQFAFTLLKSPRSDEVRKLAADRLQEYTGVDMSEAYQRQTRLSRVSAVKKSVVIESKPLSESKPISVEKPVLEAKSIQESTIAKPTTTISTKPLSANKPSANKPVINKSAVNQSPGDKSVATRKVGQPVQNRDFYYVVQEGDSLWKIGRRFSVDLEVLRAFNQLETDVLYPGRSLRIPVQK